MRTVMRLSKSNLLEKRIVFPLKNLQPQKSPAVAAAPLPLIQTKCVCEGGCPSCQKPKLTIGKPDDKHEQTANRRADEIMGGTSINETAEHQTNAQKSTSSKSGVQSTLGEGSPLPASERSYFESRFGQDFLQVRIHHDQKAENMAQRINARAFSCGNSIAFGRSEYSPTTSRGKWLLAHELAHVSQRQGPNHIQRTIKVHPDVSLDEFFAEHEIHDAQRTGDIYSRFRTMMPWLDSQIVSDMLSSGREFPLMGSNTTEAITNLKAHIEARMGIVELTRKDKPYGFGVGSNTRLNPKYWEKVIDPDTKKNKWQVKTDLKDYKEALLDIYNDKEDKFNYKIGCQLAAYITMMVGSEFSEIAVDDFVLSRDDWIPGDWGHIKNTKSTGTRGLEGENIIYVGYGQYWAHVSNSNQLKSLDEWHSIVSRWNNNGALLQIIRKRPAIGLVSAS